MKDRFMALRLSLLVLLSILLSGIRPRYSTANVETAAGSHKILTRRADAGVSHRHLLYKAGSDALHAALCGVSDYPIGSSTDSPGGAEDIFNVNPLNNSEYTRPLRCSTALAAEVDVYVAANGFVAALPASIGTYYKVGRTVAAAVQESGSNYLVEVTPCDPVKTIVIAAASGTAGTDIAAVYVAMANGPAVIKALS